MAEFELIDGEEERQFYNDIYKILENARNGERFLLCGQADAYMYRNNGFLY